MRHYAVSARGPLLPSAGHLHENNGKKERWCIRKHHFKQARGTAGGGGQQDDCISRQNKCRSFHQLSLWSRPRFFKICLLAKTDPYDLEAGTSLVPTASSTYPPPPTPPPLCSLIAFDSIFLQSAVNSPINFNNLLQQVSELQVTKREMLAVRNVLNFNKQTHTLKTRHRSSVA